MTDATYNRYKNDKEWLARKRKAVRESHARVYATAEGRARYLEATKRSKEKKIKEVGLAQWRADKCAQERARLATPAARQKHRDYQRAYQAEYRKKPEYRDWVVRTQWARTLKRDHGMSVAEYDALATAQRNQCAICQSPPTNERYGRLVVDHCHTRAQTRALLCSACNMSLGGFKDSPEILDAAAAYLRKHGGGEWLTPALP